MATFTILNTYEVVIRFYMWVVNYGTAYTFYKQTTKSKETSPIFFIWFYNEIFWFNISTNMVVFDYVAKARKKNLCFLKWLSSVLRGWGGGGDRVEERGMTWFSVGGRYFLVDWEGCVLSVLYQLNDWLSGPWSISRSATI